MLLWIVAGLAAFLLGISKSGFPIVAMLAVPLMSLFMPPAMAAGLLLPLYLIADCYAIYLFRRAYSLENLKILVPSAVIGVLTGFFAVAVVPGDAVKLLLALIGIFYLVSAQRRRFSKTPVPPRKADVPRGVFWGALAGLTSYIAHSGGPPFQAYILPQRLSKLEFLGTTAIFFASVNVMKIIPYAFAGQITMTSLSNAVWLIPFAILGAWTGAKLSNWLSDRVFFGLIEIALGLISIKLLFDVFA